MVRTVDNPGDNSKLFADRRGNISHAQHGDHDSEPYIIHFHHRNSAALSGIRQLKAVLQRRLESVRPVAGAGRVYTRNHVRKRIGHDGTPGTQGFPCAQAASRRQGNEGDSKRAAQEYHGHVLQCAAFRSIHIPVFDYRSRAVQVARPGNPSGRGEGEL